MYLVKSAVKKLIKEHNKRMSPDYLVYLSARIEKMILSHINIIGSRKTLSGHEFRVLDEYSKRKI